MKFIADMGISQTTVKWLGEQGFDAIHVRGKTVGIDKPLPVELIVA